MHAKKLSRGIKNEDNTTIFITSYCISNAGLPRIALFVDLWTTIGHGSKSFVSVRKGGGLYVCLAMLAKTSNANQSHDLKVAECCFKMCYAIHNMMFKYTGPIKVTNWENYDQELNEDIVFYPRAEEYAINEIQNPHDVSCWM